MGLKGPFAIGTPNLWMKGIFAGCSTRARMSSMRGRLVTGACHMQRRDLLMALETSAPWLHVGQPVLTLSSCMAASQTVVIFITGRRSPMNGHAPTCCLFTTNLKSCKALRLPAKAIELHLGKKSRKASRAHVGDGFGLPAAGLVASGSLSKVTIWGLSLFYRPMKISWNDMDF